MSKSRIAMRTPSSTCNRLSLLGDNQRAADRAFEHESPWPDLCNTALASGEAPTSGTDPDDFDLEGCMRAQLRRRLEMAERVRTFLRAHQLEGGVEGLGLEKLEALIARAQVLDEQQRVGLNLSRQATKQRRTVRQALEEKILRYLRAVGRVAAKHNGELANEFPLPASNASHKALLTVGRASLDKATAQKDVLVGLGMSVKVLDDLAAALGEYEQTLEASRTGRREHVEASAELETVSAEIVEQVQLLDGIVRYQFGDDPDVMGGWTSARNVLGPFKSKNEPEPGTGGGAGAAPKAA